MAVNWYQLVWIGVNVMNDCICLNHLFDSVINWSLIGGSESRRHNWSSRHPIGHLPVSEDNKTIVQMLKQLEMGLRAVLVFASKIWTFICYVIKKQYRTVCPPIICCLRLWWRPLYCLWLAISMHTIKMSVLKDLLLTRYAIDCLQIAL